MVPSAWHNLREAQDRSLGRSVTARQRRAPDQKLLTTAAKTWLIVVASVAR